MRLLVPSVRHFIQEMTELLSSMVTVYMHEPYKLGADYAETKLEFGLLLRSHRHITSFVLRHPTLCRKILVK